MNESVHLIVMCKAPIAGRVKTRLTPIFSVEEAATIHKAMATTVIERAARLFSNVTIAADDVSHPFFKPFGLPVVEQGEGDLGARMNRLMLKTFDDGAEATMFLGTDSPHMGESRLQAAVEALSGSNVVLGPVEDGGYDLIAMSGPYHQLFDGIAWGSEQVLKQTIQQAENFNVSVALLDESFDLDTPESLERAKPLWSPVV